METQRQRLIAVIVGCNYRGSPCGWPELRGAEADAVAMAGLLQKHASRNGQDGGVLLLLGSMATKAAITRAIRDACRAAEGAGNGVLIYFAGHGHANPYPQLKLYAWDGEYPAEELLYALGWPAKTDGEKPELHWPAYATGLVLDCCHAGGFQFVSSPWLGMLQGDLPAGEQVPFQALFACRTDETTGDQPTGGPFTQALITALRNRPKLLALPLDLERWRKASLAKLQDPDHTVQLKRGGWHAAKGSAAAAGSGAESSAVDLSGNYVLEDAPV